MMSGGELHERYIIDLCGIVPAYLRAAIISGGVRLHGQRERGVQV